MKKNFVLDTNVLLHDPRSMFGFADNDVVIPIYVIEEIDNFKRDLSTLGRNARQVSRYLDEFRAQGKLGEGVPLGPDKGRIFVLMTDRKLPHGAGDSHTTDDKILAVALDLLGRDRGKPTVFVTKDTNLRIRADALGLHAEDYDVEGLAEKLKVLRADRQRAVEMGVQAAERAREFSWEAHTERVRHSSLLR